MSVDKYSSDYVQGLFNEMSKTYGTVNLISSFGMALIWRKYCVRQLADHNQQTVVDLMSGMGENLGSVLQNHPNISKIAAIDFSAAMCKQLRQRQHLFGAKKIGVFEQDALQSSLQDSSVDAVYCSFGLKTLKDEQQAKLAKEINRVLKPGGRFAFIEISMPRFSLFRLLLIFYLRYLIPLIGYI